MTPARTTGAPAPVPARAAAAVVATLLAAAWGLRLWLVSRHDYLSVDAVFYLDQTARLLTTGRLPYSVFPPGWPLLVLPAAALAGPDDPAALLKAAQLLNAALGALLPLLTYRLLRPRAGFWTALAGLLITAFLPQLLVLSKTALSEMSYACFLLGGWLAARRRPGLLAGLLLGYAYLIRPEALLAAGILGLLAWRDERRPPWAFVVGVLVCVLPYVAYLKAATGAWSLSGKSVAVSLSLDAHPGWRYPGLVLRNLGALLPQLPGLVGWPLALLAVLGAVTRPGRWLAMLAPMLPIPFIINPMDVRFWAPYLPYLLLAAALGAAWIGDRMAARHVPAGRRLRAAVLAVLAAAGLGLAVADDAPYVARSAEAYYGLRDAGAWLRGRVERDTVVAAYKPYASYWAGCSFVKYPPDLTAEELVAWARAQGARYMVVNVMVVHALVPALDPLLQSPLPPSLADQVTLVQLLRFQDVGHNTAIYRVEPGGG